MLIEQTGHDIQVAHDGLTALQKVEQFGPSVALLDLGMPRTDGVEVARRIRAMQGGDKIVIVAVTEWADGRASSHEGGFDNHLSKPAYGNQLRTVLSSGRSES